MIAQNRRKSAQSVPFQAKCPLGKIGWQPQAGAPGQGTTIASRVPGSVSAQRAFVEWHAIREMPDDHYICIPSFLGARRDTPRPRSPASRDASPREGPRCPPTSNAQTARCGRFIVARAAPATGRPTPAPPRACRAGRVDGKRS